MALQDSVSISAREIFFTNEEKNEVKRPKVSVTQGHGTESVNVLTLS